MSSQSPTPPLGDISDFRECCAQQRWFCDLGIIELATAVDNMQRLAERWGLIDAHGQDPVQTVMADQFSDAGASHDAGADWSTVVVDVAEEIGASPTTVGKARSQVSTDGQVEERTGRDGKSYRLVARDGVASAAELQRMIDNWGDVRRRRLGPAQSVVDAFWYVVRLDDPDYLVRWLKNHPLDAPHLYEIWGAKCSTAAA